MPSIRWTELPRLTSFSFAKLFGLKPKGENRRESPRTRSKNLIKIEEDKGQNLSNLIDLSETGLCFVTAKKPRVGTVLQMVINLAEQNRQVPLIGKIAWVKQDGGAIHVGVSFVEISDTDRELIRGFVSKRRSS